MTTIPHRVLAAALATTALGAGGAASLAGAATPTSGTMTALATAMAHMRPVIHERVNPLNARNRWTTLRPGAISLRRYAAQLAEVPADTAQRTAKQDWVSGVRLEARGNLGVAAGLQAKLKHDPSLYRTDVVRGRDTLRRANQLVRSAEVSVGLHASSPVHFVYCARDICPAG